MPSFFPLACTHVQITGSATNAELVRCVQFDGADMNLLGCGNGVYVYRSLYTLTVASALATQDCSATAGVRA